MSPSNRVTLVLAWMPLAAAAYAQDAAEVDFAREIQPILESACLNCHNEQKAEGGLRLDSLQAALDGGDVGPTIVPGDPDESTLYVLTVLDADDPQVMPPEGPPLDASQSERLRQWIEQGAKWPEDAQLQVQPRIDFVQHIQPILEQNCVSCHSPELAEGELDLSTRTRAFETGILAPSIIPYSPERSFLYELTTLGADDQELMPPANAGGPLDEGLRERLRLWIAQGAIWPEGVTLTAKAGTPVVVSTPDSMDLVKRIHTLIAEKSKTTSEAEMSDYTAKVPRTGAAYHMVAIPGGEFLMGSPPDEPHRQADEGPQVNVSLSPFWMGKYEVTWDEYEPFMLTRPDRHKHGARKDYDPAVHDDVDAVSQPTKPYMEMSFGMGQFGYPAISMTQHAASKYCQWLSAQTGHFYRLPTEAEWEYACRAGTTTAYSFGDDPALLDEYAWYFDNGHDKYQKVGQKKPNPWGLYDMHGNVREWTADRFVADYFQQIQGSATNPFLRPDALYPRSVRGGGWNDDAAALRSASRLGSDPEWKHQDPQLPKSIWYHTDARSLGFRIVRPLEIPTPEEMSFYWNSATGMNE